MQTINILIGSFLLRKLVANLNIKDTNKIKGI